MLTAQKIAVNDMRGMCKRESRHIATSFFGVERLAGRCMKNKHKDNINELHCTRSISFRNACVILTFVLLCNFVLTRKHEACC